MRKDSSRGKAVFRSITTMFMTAVLASEGLHVPTEHHNPHGNRRERIEELRQRTFETEQMTSGRGMARASGNPPPPQPAAVATHISMGRRRMFNSDSATMNRPA